MSAPLAAAPSTSSAARRLDVDFVVIGAGSSGSVVASRLSEAGRHRVLLLEAGGPMHPLSRVPISYAFFIGRQGGTNWLYRSEPEATTAQRQVSVPRGRMLGGSSCINGTTWVRGHPADFDHWRQLGNRGWSFTDVLPIFREIESYPDGDPEWRGRGGPIEITEAPRDAAGIGQLYESVISACADVGIPFNPDYNGADQEGVGMSQGSISRRGIRMSTAECYLKPARSRSNLMVRTHATATTLLFEGTRCTGVRYAVDGGGMEEAFATCEVVLCAGAIASPQLLELSGIGQPERLASHGIEVRHAMRGVGENLQDHYSPRLKYRLARKGVTYNERARGLGRIQQGLNWFFRGTGLLAMPPGAVRGFFRTNEREARPDAIFMVTPFLADAARRMAPDPGIAVAVHQLRPESRGGVHVTGMDPASKPAIRFNFLHAEADRACLLASMRIARRIVASPALQWLEPEELLPGTAKSSDDDLLDYVFRTAETTYHPCGTCKMGDDPAAVVDDRLRVHGITGLRVADASIMPTLVSGNTNAACIMIGEKAARMILQDRQAA